jgi:hypothetical protein
MGDLVDLSAICFNRAHRLLNNVPSSRFELISPYPTYTQQQLNMRRKAEILKYNHSSQSNRITRSEQWAQYARGTSSTSRFVNRVDPASNVLPCGSDDMIPTPSSSCNVPGPITFFVRDVTIPLYLYQSNNRNYGIIDDGNNQNQ